MGHATRPHRAGRIPRAWSAARCERVSHVKTGRIVPRTWPGWITPRYRLSNDASAYGECTQNSPGPNTTVPIGAVGTRLPRESRARERVARAAQRAGADGITAALSHLQTIQMAARSFREGLEPPGM